MKVNTLRYVGKNYFFIAGDWHYDQLNPAAYDCLIAHANKYPFEKRWLIINGDFLDFWFFMKKHPLFKRWIKRSDGIDEFFLPHYEEEIAWGNKLLDDLTKEFAGIVYIEGNHEYGRLNDFLELIPVGYKDNFGVEKSLSLRSRGIAFIRYNDWLDIGSYGITHGQWCANNALKKHFMSASKNIVISHVHRDEAITSESRSETYHAYSTPAMSSRPGHEYMKYMRNKDSRHTTGYALLISDGVREWYNNYPVIDGKTAALV